MGAVPGMTGIIAAFGGSGSGGGGGGGSSIASPTFVGVSTSNYGDFGTYIGESPAAAQVDDIVISIHLAASAKASVGTWTQITSKAFSSGVVATLLWRRVATAGVSYTSDYGSYGSSGTKFIVVRGCPTGSSPVDTSATQNEATGTSVTLPAVTTTQANDMVLLFSVHPSAATSGSWTNATLGTVIERFDGLVYDYFHIASAVMASAGATGTTAMTLSSSRTHLDLTLALKGN